MLPLLSSPLTYIFFPRFFSLRAVAHREYVSPLKLVLVLRWASIAILAEPSQVRGPPCHIRGATPDAPGHLASRRLAASCTVGTFVSNDLLSVRAPAPATQY